MGQERSFFMTGVIKWFDESKGYGFITGDDGKDIFVHFSAFPGGHTRGLGDLQGRAVMYEAAGGADGKEHAEDVRFI